MSVMFSGARLSVLDLAPINEGSTVTQALDNAATLAAHVEQLGYQRYWMAEHHNMPGIASSATAVALAHVASRTSTIRVGAGGVMLPNHAPLVIAEQFGTLAALHPGRIDLGLGRAPGTDQTTAQALRRTLNQSVDSFPQDVMELQAYFGEVQPGQRVQAVPGANSEVPLWILGSSLYGAQLAAALGLPYAFASHFAPAAMQQAIDTYRSQFKPSAQLDKPYFMLGFNICAAETEERAHLMRSSSLQALVRMRRGMPGQLPPPIENYEANLTAEDRYLMQQFTSCSAVGTAEQVSEELTKFVAQTQPNEIMVVSQVFDQQDRLESFRIVADLASKTESRQTATTLNPAMAAPSAG